MKPMLPVFAAALFVLAGCGSSSTTPDAAPKTTAAAKSKCTMLDQAALANIADGLKDKTVTLRKGAAVKLRKSEAGLGINYAVAVSAKDASSTEKLILGMSKPVEGGGPIVASDHLARLYFTWGEAAAKGSPMGNLRDSIFLTKAARAAQNCL